MSAATEASTDTDTGTDARVGVVGEIRAVLNARGAVSALLSGSVVLAGAVCGCAGRVLRWAWAQASTDAEATAAAQAKAKAAKAKAGGGDQDQEQAEVTAPPVAPVRRPLGEALAYFALGGLLAAGAAGSAGVLLSPYLGLLTTWKPVIISVGGAGWMIAAWMVAPPPQQPAEDGQDDAEGDDLQDDAAPIETADRGAALLWHVLQSLADAESARRAGVHLDVVLASATETGLLPEDTEQSDFRAWVESCGLPTVDKLGMRIEGKPVTRVGLRVDAATGVLGTTPTALLQTRPGGVAVTPAQPVGDTPAEAPASTPAEVPVEVPVPAALRLIPGGRPDPSAAAPLTLSKERVQEAR
ncbi:hypothetical protein OG285_38465 [Streptomyces sp. NBC_01471]|uniref:hypothetical protein n=1 Tax=Streptomyces sp. NBC_01471 TaxID=2903879 RepID=UPI003250C1BF